MRRLSSISAGVLFLTAGVLWLQVPKEVFGQLRDEEAFNYYQKWLLEDVFYIISEEEKSVFQQLTTEQERDAFIEEFWLRRDSDPATAENEFKEEHYRRISYSNEHFHSGEPGWKTDRGEVYIKFGPPSMVESYPSGGPYARRMSEGGGRTVAYPFERWRYNHIDGIGPNVEIEFVDPSRTGEYRLALSPQDKDAFLTVPNAGLTEGEMAGLEGRWLRMTRDMGLGIQSRSSHYAMQPDDFPFERLARLAQIQKAPAQVRFRELKEEVSARVSFAGIPFKMHLSHIRISSGRYLVPITIEVKNRDLSYQQKEDFYEAQVQVYGSVSDMGRKTWFEFDHQLVNRSTESEFAFELTGVSLFQRAAHLPPGRYRVDIFLKDPSSGRLGTLQESLIIAEVPEDSLELSPIVLARRLEPAEEHPERFEQFEIGGLKVVPNTGREFLQADILHIYLQAYNVRLDQSHQEPSLAVSYFLMKDGRIVESFPDLEGKSISYVSTRRVVLTTGFRLSRLSPGHYNLLVRVRDAISGQQQEGRADFDVS